MKALAILLACTSSIALAEPPAAPPPNPAHVIRGTIRFAPVVKAKKGTAIFIVAKSATAKGPPLAVDKLVYDGKDLPFVLDDSNSMIAGSDLEGDVIVMARYDQDGDAVTKARGDFKGEARVTVPAKGVVIVIDTPMVK